MGMGRDIVSPFPGGRGRLAVKKCPLSEQAKRFSDLYIIPYVKY